MDSILSRKEPSRIPGPIHEFTFSVLNAIPTFHLEGSATRDLFVAALESEGDAVAFIGHSLTISARPEWNSVGLQLWDGYIVKRMTPDQPFGGNTIELNNTIIDTIRVQKKVVFIASCSPGPIFESLFDLGGGVPTRALILPVGDNTQTDLFYSAHAWRLMANALSRGQTVAQAVEAGNQYLSQNMQSLRFRVIGKQDVRIR
jgi:hypothetical protein